MANDAQFDLAAVRELLLAAFTAETLPRFCRYRPPLRPVVNNFGPGQGLDDMVDEVITYCETRLLWAELLASIEEDNPRQYARFAHRLSQAPAGPVPSIPGAAPVPRRVVNAAARPDVRLKFHDRAAELAWLRGCLADPNVRLISVIGHGGYGKTALVARAMVEAETGPLRIDGRDLQVRGIAYFHPGHTGLTLGRLYADLGTLLGDACASLLTNRWQDPARSLQQKADLLLEQAMRATHDGEVILVVLDALEEGLDDSGQVADEGLRLWLEACLESGGPVRVIATSRQEWLLPDGAMPFVRQWNLESGLPEAEGVAVLRALDPDGRCRLSHADEGLLEQAVRQTQGVPFSLEKIAGLLRKSRQLSLEQLLADDTIYQQEVTLALAERALSHLSPEEQRVMEGLAVYRRPVPAAAIASILDAVVGLEELATVEAVLEELARGYFVTYHWDGGLWALHGMDAQVVCTRSSPEEQAALHRRAGEYYAVGKGVDRDEWDLVRAVHHFQRGGNYARAVGLVAGNVQIINNRGLASELRPVLEEFRAGQLEAEDWVEIALARGDVYTLLGDGDQAQDSYQEALAQLAALPDSPAARERTAKACRGMARLLQNESPDEALEWLERGLAELAGSSTLEEAELLLRRGGVLISKDEYVAAVEALEQCLRLLPERSDDLRARALGNLGAAWCSQGDLGRGGEQFERALEIFQRAHNYWGEAGVLHNLGMIREFTGDWMDAAARYQQALELAERLGDVERQMELEFSLGILQTKRGDYDSALGQLTKFLELAGSHLKGQRIYAYSSLADLRIRRDELEEAEASLDEAERLAREMPARSRLPEIYRLRAEVRLAQGQTQPALEMAAQAVNVARELEDLDPMEEGTARRALGQALWAVGQVEPALAAFDMSLHLLEERDPYEAGRTRMQWGKSLLAAGEVDRGTALLRQAGNAFAELGAARDAAAVEELLAKPA